MDKAADSIAFAINELAGIDITIGVDDSAETGGLIMDEIGVYTSTILENLCASSMPHRCLLRYRPLTNVHDARIENHSRFTFNLDCQSVQFGLAVRVAPTEGTQG